MNIWKMYDYRLSCAISFCETLCMDKSSIPDGREESKKNRELKIINFNFCFYFNLLISIGIRISIFHKF